MSVTSAMFRSGDGTLVLVSSPLHLHEGDIADRIVDEGAALISPNERGTANAFASPPRLTYFTIPQHLLENLWASELPKLTGNTACAHDSDGDDQRSALEVLSMMIVAADETIEQVRGAVLHFSAAEDTAQEPVERDLNRIVSALQGNAAVEVTGMIACLNIDDSARTLELDAAGRPTAAAAGAAERPTGTIRAEVAPAEAVIWDVSRLRVLESRDQASGLAKMLIHCSRRVAEQQ